MKFRDYLSFKDTVTQTCQSLEIEFDKSIEESPLWKKGRIEANPRGYFFIVRKISNQKDLNSGDRKYFEQCINHRASYKNELIEKMLQSIDFPNIKITEIIGRLKIDSIKSEALFVPRSFYFTEEYTVKFDDLSYLALKTLSR